MRKTLLLLAVALATFAENAWADKSFKTLPELTYGVAISPSGQYLVGVNPSYNGLLYKSDAADERTSHKSGCSLNRKKNITKPIKTNQ